MNFEEFKQSVKEVGGSINKLMQFMDNISPEENKLRWERLHALNLTLILFLNSYGYDFQKTDKKRLEKILEFPRVSKILKNYIKLIENEKLEDQKEVRKLLKIIRKHYS